MSTYFYPLRVLDVRPETDDAVVLTLEPAESDRDRFSFAPGQHLTLRTEIDGEDIRRNYSMIASPEEGVLRVAIKRIADGRFSRWAMQSLNTGDTIDSMTPRGHFTWDF